MVVRGELSLSFTWEFDMAAKKRAHNTTHVSTIEEARRAGADLGVPKRHGAFEVWIQRSTAKQFSLVYKAAKAFLARKTKEKLKTFAFTGKVTGRASATVLAKDIGQAREKFERGEIENGDEQLIEWEWADRPDCEEIK